MREKQPFLAKFHKRGLSGGTLSHKNNEGTQRDLGTMKPADFLKPAANTITYDSSADAARRDDTKPSGRINTLVRNDPNHAQAQKFALSGAPLLAH